MAQITLNIFHHFALRYTAQHGCRQENCMKATETNMEDSECDTERGNSEQVKNSDKRQNKEILPKRGATSVAWTWFGYEKSDMDQKTVLCKLCRHMWPFYINYLFIEFTENVLYCNMYWYLDMKYIRVPTLGTIRVKSWARACQVRNWGFCCQVSSPLG